MRDGTIHKDAHPLAGKIVKIVGGQFDGEDYYLEDWWDRLGQGSWQWCKGNPACIEFAMRSGMEDAQARRPDITAADDVDEVVYGKIKTKSSVGVIYLGKLMHVRQLGELVTA